MNSHGGFIPLVDVAYKAVHGISLGGGSYQNLVSDSCFHSLGYAYFKDKNRLSDVPAPPARARSASSFIVYFHILRSSCLEFRSQRGYNPAYLQILKSASLSDGGSSTLKTSLEIRTQAQ